MTKAVIHPVRIIALDPSGVEDSEGRSAWPQ